MVTACNSAFLICVYTCMYIDQRVWYVNISTAKWCVRIGMLSIRMYTYVSSLLVLAKLLCRTTYTIPLNSQELSSGWTHEPNGHVSDDLWESLGMSKVKLPTKKLHGQQNKQPVDPGELHACYTVR